jgi:hypothetical protein
MLEETYFDTWGGRGRLHEGHNARIREWMGVGRDGWEYSGERGGERRRRRRRWRERMIYFLL